jgi:hypothetical protein
MSCHAIPPITATDIERQSHRPVLYCISLINCAFQNSILPTSLKKRPIQCEIYSKRKVLYHHKKFNTVPVIYACNIIYSMFNTFFMTINIHLFYLFFVGFGTEVRLIPLGIMLLYSSLKCRTIQIYFQTEFIFHF